MTFLAHEKEYGLEVVATPILWSSPSMSMGYSTSNVMEPRVSLQKNAGEYTYAFKKIYIKWPAFAKQ